MANSACCNLRHVQAILLLLCLTFPAGRAVAVTNVFLPVADTSLLEINPANNLGGFAGMNAGTTQEFYRTRALMRFDLTSLPTNSIILSAWLQLEVTRQPDESPFPSSFGLRRMLRAWGEGSKSPLTQPGKGLPASPGEATWLCAFHPTNTWTIPGGAPDVDFSSVESASQFIYGTGESPYPFETTPELVADIIAWVSQPASNFGWMLLSNDESSNFTARRFGTREDASYPPLLEIQYLVPPSIDAIQKLGNQFNLSFLACAGQTYVIEFRESLTTGPWQIAARLNPFLQDTRIVVVDTVAAPQRFYRLNTF